jgi:hypothetical protein
MTTLLDRRNDRRNDSTRGFLRSTKPGMPATAGVLVALQAAAASFSIVMVPVVLAWATASFSAAPWGKALLFGVGTWLLAHHAGIVIPGGHFGLVPLGLMALPAACCWLAGVRLARNLDPNAADLRAGVGRARPVMPPTRALVLMVATYSCLATVASVLVTTVSVRPLAAQAFVGAATISSAAGVCGAAAWVEGGALPGVRLVLRRCRRPGWMSRVGPPVLLAIVMQLTAGALIFTTALVLGWNRVLLLHQAISPGVTGGLVLILAQLTAVPNLVIWAASVAAGPGFAVGAGTSVAAGQTTMGLLPAVPILGALPQPGPNPAWLWGLLAIPALSGVVLGLVLVRRTPHASLVDVALDIGRAALLVGAVWFVLGWLSGGPAGPGALARVGPVMWQLGLSMMAEVGAGAALTAGVLLAIRHFSQAPDEAPDA